MEWNSEKFLNDVYKAVHRRNAMQRLDTLLTDLPALPNIDEALEDLSASAWARVVDGKRLQRSKTKRLKKAFRIVGFGVFIIMALVVSGIMIYRANPGHWNQVIATYTPTPTSTFTPTPTPTPTSTPTPTPTSTLTPTPIPPSTYLFSDLNALYPSLPIGADSAWIIDDTKAVVEPALDDANVWIMETSPDPSASMEPYYYTNLGDTTISWEMDVPMVTTGFYALYVTDTLENSTGKQSFTAMLDGDPVVPYRGQSSVIFGEKGVNGQSTDDWLLLGIYEVARGQNLSVMANIGSRSEEMPFAIDRLLILKLSETQQSMIDNLVSGRPLVSLMDDDRAIFFAEFNGLALKEEYQGIEQTDALAWKNQFRSLDLTGEKWDYNRIGNEIWVDWQPLGRLAAGQYELYVWVPAQHATAVVDFALLANGVIVERPNPAPLNQKDHAGVWVSLGIWDLSEESAVSVRMIISRANQAPESAEIGVDAVALVRVGD